MSQIPKLICAKCDSLAGLRGAGCQCCKRETLLIPCGEIDFDEIYLCPHCLYAADSADAFDCLGADEDSLFCNWCMKEFTIDAGQVTLLRMVSNTGSTTT